MATTPSVGAAPSDANPSIDSLRATIQRQADTIESLHAAASKYKTRLTALEQQLTVKQAEIDSLKAMQSENASLREEAFVSNERNRELELTIGRLTEASTLGAETQAQLGVKVQAYQRHNHYLQGEVAARTAKLRSANERIDVLAEELRAKDRRITILVEKLRQYNIDPSSSVSKVQVNEEVFARMKDELSSQNATLEVMREKVESMQEEAVRREEIMGALRKENNALKQTVSKLVAQISGGSAAAAAAATTGVTVAAGSGSAGRSHSGSDPSSPPRVTDKLAAYHRAKLDQYVRSP